MRQEDIDVTTIQITDVFRYHGRVYRGLDDLRKSSKTRYSDSMGEPPFAVRIEKSYPCFDSSDFLYEDRSYQTYYLTMDEEKAAKICEETYMSDRDFSNKGIERQYPVLEPMFSMSKIQERHLPYIYYHGDGDTMEIVQDRNAEEQVEVVYSAYRRGVSIFDDPDPTPCLYGPPTDIDWYEPDPLADEQEETDDKEDGFNFD